MIQLYGMKMAKEQKKFGDLIKAGSKEFKSANVTGSINAYSKLNKEAILSSSEKARNRSHE